MSIDQVEPEKSCETTSLREKLAELCHKQWSGWMLYLFGKGSHTEAGTWIMPKWAVDRWTRQMAADYNELSEQEKDQDRDEADRFIKIIDNYEDLKQPKFNAAEHALLHPNGMTDECGKLVEVEQPGPALEIEQSCGNCFHFAKCRSLGITDSADRTECDFTPSRWKEPTTFTPKPEPQEQSEQEITTEEYARYALKFIGELQQQIDELSERIKKLEEI